MAEFVHQKYTSTRKTSINKCKTILCDVDEVVNNLVEKSLSNTTDSIMTISL